MKICFRCKQEIKEGSNFFSFTEFNLSSVVKVDYAHKECWDKFLKKVGDTDEAMGVVRGLKNKLTEMGMLPPEEVIIK